jgi:hypothetical protein
MDELLLSKLSEQFILRRIAELKEAFLSTFGR